MKAKNPIIFIVDDEASVRRSFSLLLSAAGYSVESFARSDEFLARESYLGIGCILLDINLDGKSGLELQDEIREQFSCLPIIYITGIGNVPMSVQALKKGAINFLQKPVDEKQLIESVDEALEKSKTLCADQVEKSRLRSLFETLTPREIEIFLLVITGLLNKQIAGELNIAEQTVKIHRGKITEKLGVKSVAEMVRIAEKLHLL
ncbi:MAG: response regulator [Bacteroidales bacterium]